MSRKPLTEEQKEAQRLANRKSYQKYKNKRLEAHKEYRQNNPEKSRAYTKKWNKKNPSYNKSYWDMNKDRRKANRIRREYGLTRESYESMISGQGGRCKICRTEFCHLTNQNVCIDHDHSTGFVRGILCGNCNKMLGLARDNMDILESAIAYLMESKNGIKD